MVRDYSCFPEITWKTRSPEITETCAEYYGAPGGPDEYMPEWPESECTHYQMYEDTSEGTPISPIFATPEELARWLADNGTNAGAGMTASYEEWLRMIVGPGASVGTFGSIGGKVVSGVALAAGSE